MAKNLRAIAIFLLYIVFVFLSFSSVGCSQKTAKTQENVAQKVEREIVEKFKREKAVQRTVPSTPLIPPPPIVEPTYEEIDPFEGRTFTMSAVDAPLTKVLYAIADGAGMNLIISPEVDKDQKVTATFTGVPLRDALDIVMDMTGLYYEVRGNVIYVKEIMTRTFHLPYLSTVTNCTSNLGGDVLGGSLTGGLFTGGFGGFAGTTSPALGTGFGTSGLRGNFSIDYKTPQDATDFFKQIEDNVKSLLSKKGKFILNRFSGTLIVTDKRRNVEKVERFVNQLKQEVGRQVLIEAKIVELSLKDEFQFGVDWNAFIADVLGTGTNITLSQNLALTSGGYANISVVRRDFSALINALAIYGKIYTLSNPRILVANGQTALIATGQITPFFERQALTFFPTATPTAQVQESILRTNVLEGIMLGVTPYIDKDGNIIMNIVPVATRLDGTKRLTENGRVLAEAPVLNIKEAGTIVKVRDGEMIVIGGLIGDVNSVVEDHVPGLGRIPLLGNLFKRKRVFKEKRELIIFLRPTVVFGRDL